MHSWRRQVVLGVVAILLSVTPVGAQEDTASEAESPVFLPSGDFFEPLLADPKEPHFYASYLRQSSAARTADVGSVAFGTNLGIIRWRHGSTGDGLQVGLSGGVFAQFNLDERSRELVNADYVIGLPISFRRGDFSARLRIYHQSSHLGDEFLQRTNIERENLSFQSVELLLSRRFGPVRGYGGGEIRFDRSPRELKRGVLHGGLEFRYPGTLFRLGSLGSARPVAALDTKSWQQLDWRLGWSGRTGIELHSTGAAGLSSRRMSLLLEWYDGPTPFGQFYEDHTSYFGLGFHVHF